MYTRRGDSGETSLYGSKRVAKDSPRVEAYGSIDELSSLIGLAISLSKERAVASGLREVQAMLFRAAADSATGNDQSPGVERIGASDVARLEEMTDELLKRLPPLRNFIYPGGSQSAASIQFARAVCRRAERRVLAASKAEAMNLELKPFFNRLSSYLFNLGRYANLRARRREDVWRGRQASGSRRRP